MQLINRNLAVLSLAVSLGTIAMGLGAPAPAFAGPHGGGGGGGGGGGKGGGGGGGGVAHFSAAHISGGRNLSASHVSHASHVSASHWSGGRHYSHVTHSSGRTHTAGIHSHTNLSKTNLSKSNVNHNNLNHQNLNHANLNAGQNKNLNAKNLNAHVTPLKHAADPHNFGIRRGFATNAALQSFWHNGWHQNWWHQHGFFHLGWIGPWFWPFAYGDFFYFALWPWDYWYYDPFWAYGYGDIYQAVFFPYGYDDYVQGPRAPERMARLKAGIVQGCNEEAGEVTGWPIDQIQAAVEPDQRQSQMLDDLGNAIVNASNEIRSHCQANIAFTPTGRLDQMHERVQSLVEATNTVSPALSAFYDSLNDEQKARFDHVAPQASRRGQSAQRDLTTLNVQAQCDAGMMAWPADQIDRVVRPDDAQRAKLQALQSAATQAADTIKAACPTAMPATPPARIAAVGRRLQAMLQGVETMQPALTGFYDSLSDDQKARFNTMGRQLFAQGEIRAKSE
jgi:uncharacterized protein YjbI with pentapeptide repeats